MSRIWTSHDFNCYDGKYTVELASVEGATRSHRPVEGDYIRLPVDGVWQHCLVTARRDWAGFYHGEPDRYWYEVALPATYDTLRAKVRAALDETDGVWQQIPECRAAREDLAGCHRALMSAKRAHPVATEGYALRAAMLLPMVSGSAFDSIGYGTAD